MVELKIKNLDKTPPRASTILLTCKNALIKEGYLVEEDFENHKLIINPDRGPRP